MCSTGRCFALVLLGLLVLLAAAACSSAVATNDVADAQGQPKGELSAEDKELECTCCRKYRECMYESKNPPPTNVSTHSTAQEIDVVALITIVVVSVPLALFASYLGLSF